MRRTSRFHTVIAPACRHALFTLALAVFLPSSAMAADKAGCAETAGLARFAGSSIVMCEPTNFQSYVLPLGLAKTDADGAPADGFEKSLTVEGKLTQNVYAAPEGVGSEEVLRTYRADLEAKGYKVLFAADGAQTARIGAFFEAHGPGTELWDDYNSDTAHYLAAVKEDGPAKTYVALFLNQHLSGYNPNFTPAENQVAVRLDTLQVGDLNDQMVKVSAGEIAKDIDASGRVALYGILFDFNEATIKPESRTALDEIGKYLKDHPAQKIYIVGHTDNVGGYDFNMKLSQARAQAVLTDLERNYGIAQSRLRGAGVGFLSPVAPNTTDGGRAKNRRVELLPQ